MPNQTSTDTELVTAYLAGDRGAFAAMYDRYGAGLYDTAAAMLRNRHDAADTVQDVFVIAAERLDQLRDPSRLKPWLYAVLRNEVYRRTGKRSRTVATDFTEPTAEMSLPTEPASESSDAEYTELTELVRNAAAGLDERDQLVLEYTIRQGLEGDDLAAALGVTPQQSYNLVHRMRQRTERSLGALCVARGGRKDCPDLDAILGNWDGTFSVLVRKRVARHIDDCDICERSRRRFVPLALFGAAPAFAAPPDLRDRVLAAATRGGASPSYGFTAAGGFPASARHAGRLALWILIASAALLLTTGTTVYMLADDDESDFLASAPTSSTLPFATSTTTATTPTEAVTTSTSSPATTVTSSSTTTPTTTTSSTSTTSSSSTTSTTLAVTSTTALSVLPPGPTTTIRPATSTTIRPPITAPPVTAPPVTDPPVTDPPVTAPPATTTTVAPTTTIAPAQLALSSGAIDFGTTAASITVTLSNSGGQPVTWAAGAAAPFAVSPASGVLPAGGSTALTVTYNRSGLPDGTVSTGTLAVAGGPTSASSALSGTVRRPPTLTVVSTQCQSTNVGAGTLYAFLVQVRTADDNPAFPQPAGSIVSPSGSTRTLAFNFDSPTWYGSATLTTASPAGPPVTEFGTWTWTISATDAVGNVTTTSGSIAVNANSCSGR